MKKRFLAGLLAVSMGFGLVGCGDTKSSVISEYVLFEADNDTTWDIFRLEQAIPYNCTVTQDMGTYSVSMTYCDNNSAANYAVFDENGEITSAFDFVSIGEDMYAHCLAEGVDVYMHAVLSSDEDVSSVISNNTTKISSEDILSITYTGESSDGLAIYVDTEELSEDGEVEYFTYVINKQSNIVNSLIRKDENGNVLNILYIEPAIAISYDKTAVYEEVDIYTILWEMVAWMFAYTTEDDV